MGIVVCLSMLAGLLVVWPRTAGRRWLAPLHTIAPWVLIIFGGWNTLWYGVQNWSAFWGIAALVSGVFMFLSGLMLLPSNDRLAPIQSALGRYKRVLILGLAVSFLLYAVTLVQLNLGLPILG